ncbi:hypothetical protein ABG067_002123 [Albugo candida]
MVRYMAILSVVAIYETLIVLSFTHSYYDKSSRNRQGEINVMALGDWGAPDDGTYMIQNQKSVAAIMNSWTEKHGACHVLDLGDSFYPYGVRTFNRTERLEVSYVEVYKELHKEVIEWSGVYGNHDFGQGAPLCIQKVIVDVGADVDVDDDKFTLERITCDTKEKVIEALNDMAEAQTGYAKENKLWHAKKNFYTETFTNDDLVVDLPKTGEKTCTAKPDVVKACVDHLNNWEDKSFEMVEAKACVSKADYKVLVSHYNVLMHMDVEKQKRWLNLFKECGITLSLNGHDHTMAYHKYEYTTYLTSGNGGGIKARALSRGTKNSENAFLWQQEEEKLSYGFLALSFTKKEITAQFVVVDAGPNEAYKVIHTVNIPRVAHDAPFSSKNVSNLQTS